MLSLLSYLKSKYIEQIRFAGNTYHHIQKAMPNEYFGIHPTAEPVAGYDPHETEREHPKKQQLSRNIHCVH